MFCYCCRSLIASRASQIPSSPVATSCRSWFRICKQQLTTLRRAPKHPKGVVLRSQALSSTIFHLVIFRWLPLHLINSSLVLGPLATRYRCGDLGQWATWMLPSKCWRVNSRNARGSRQRWGSSPRWLIKHKPNRPLTLMVWNLKYVVGPGRVISSPFSIPSSDWCSWWIKPFHPIRPANLQVPPDNHSIFHLYSLTKKNT